MDKYSITKIDTTTEKETNYGSGYSQEDVSDITRGYVFNGLFYERKNSKYIFVVSEA